MVSNRSVMENLKGKKSVYTPDGSESVIIVRQEMGKKCLWERDCLLMFLVSCTKEEPGRASQQDNRSSKTP